MVRELGAIPGRILAAVRRDLAAFATETRAALQPLEPVEPGLHAYRFGSNGARRRVHLRIQDDGSGVLFVDVSDVIHLSPTAAEMAKLALDGEPEERAAARIRRTFGSAPEVEAAHRRIRRLIDHVVRPEVGCPTCALELPRSPLFGTRARAPFKVDLALTYACNNDCPHCYNEPDRFELSSLDREGWERVLDLLAEVGVPHVIFTGGEATLHPDLPDLIAHARDRGQVAGLNSNARRLGHRPYAEELLRAGLEHLQVTVESHRPEVHDAMQGTRAFDQTIRGLRTALEVGIPSISNTTLTLRNRGHVEETLDFLHDLGIRTFAMNGMIYSGGGTSNPDAIPEPELAPLLVRIRDHAASRGMRFLWYTPTEYCRMSPVELELGAKRCNAGEYSMCVEPNGDVLPCQSFYVSAGNLLRDPWPTIWGGALFRSFRDREDDPGASGLPEKCWECPDLPLCGGGCRIEREAREATAGEGPGACAGCGNGSPSPPGRSDGRTVLRSSNRPAGLPRGGAAGCRGTS